IQIRRNGSRKIDGSKPAVTQQKAMIVAAAVNRAPYDVTSRIDPKATERLCCSRNIDGGKFLIAQQKTMERTAAVDVEADDVASRVDPIRDRKDGSRHVDLYELLLLASCLHRRRRQKAQRQQNCCQCYVYCLHIYFPLLFDPFLALKSFGRSLGVHWCTAPEL